MTIDLTDSERAQAAPVMAVVDEIIDAAFAGPYLSFAELDARADLERAIVLACAKAEFDAHFDGNRRGAVEIKQRIDELEAGGEG